MSKKNDTKIPMKDKLNFRLEQSKGQECSSDILSEPSEEETNLGVFQGPI